MPYELKGDCVHKVGEDKPLKCYPGDKEAAKKYLAALEANVPDANKSMKKAFQGMLEQSEVHYIPLSATKGKACANCRWFMNDGCFIVESYDPEPIIATGYCDRWEATPPPAPDLEDAIVEAVAEAVTNVTGAITNALPTPPTMDMGKELGKEQGLFERFKNWLATEKPETGLPIMKGADGKYYWHAIFTNNYEDRESEILTKEAHQRYETRVQMGLVPMPKLITWHQQDTAHGEADAVWFGGDHFMHAIGHFTGTPAEIEKNVKFYKAHPVKISVGGFSPTWAFDGKHYKDYNAFDISTLPPHSAANLYTSFEEIGKMALTPEKRRWIEDQFGKEKLVEIEAADLEKAKTLDELKVKYKDFSNAVPKTEQPIEKETNPLSAAYVELVKEQNEYLDLVKAMDKALEAKDAKIVALEKKFDTETAAWQKSLDSVLAIVNATPRRASQDVVTVVKDSEKEVLKDKLPTGDAIDSFWGVPLKAGN